jgi:hypothetical protein
LIETGIEITRQNLEYFEIRFDMPSAQFYEKYQSGETDFKEIEDLVILL